ncbi:MAG: serine protease [Archangium sp.]|nr:serine protease [Archangium sp.]
MDKKRQNDLILRALRSLTPKLPGFAKRSLESISPESTSDDQRPSEVAGEALRANTLDALAASVEAAPEQIVLVADLLDPRTLNGATPQSVAKEAARLIRDTTGVLEVVSQGKADQQPSEEQMKGLEAIVRLTGRPSFLVRRGDIDKNETNAAWPTLLLATAQKHLQRNIASVGRISSAAPGMRAIALGTGWVAGDRLVMTNRHVAAHFAEFDSASKKYRIRPGSSVSVDFLFEEGSAHCLVLKVDAIEHLESSGPDLALLRMEKSSELPPPLQLATNPAEVSDTSDELFVVGYPGSDLTANRDALERIFGGIFGRKRLAPGYLMDLVAADACLAHDCTTLPGSSGSCVVRVATGKVVGLHFAGAEQARNEAVLIAKVQDRLKPFSLNWVG